MPALGLVLAILSGDSDVMLLPVGEGLEHTRQEAKPSEEAPRGSIVGHMATVAADIAQIRPSMWELKCEVGVSLAGASELEVETAGLLWGVVGGT